MPDPFLVMATQNPIEQEGVYPLPEAQRDRFLMKIVVGYPTDAEEREIVYRMGVNAPEPAAGAQPRGPDARCRPRPTRCSSTTRWSTTRSGWCWPPATPAEHGVPDVAQLIQYGASPRASLGLVRATRALALMRGRDYALPQDVQDIAPDILRHRLVLTYDALADDVPADHIVDRVLAAVPLPSVAPRQHADRRPPGPAAAAARPPASRLRCRLPAQPGGRLTRRRVGAPVVPTGSPASRPERRRRRGVGHRAGRGTCCSRLQLLITRKLDGLLQGDYLGLLPGPGQRGGGVPGVPPRRRRAPDGLAGHRAHHRAARAADRRRPRAGDLARVDLSASLDFGTAQCSSATWRWRPPRRSPT